RGHSVAAVGGGTSGTDVEAGTSSLVALRSVVEGWQLGGGSDELAEALALLDQLAAKLHRDVAELDAAQAWQHDGATSMTAWLRDRGGMTRAHAAGTVRTARRLRRWPATAQAWEGGSLSGGQVQAIS